jgi:hypothetical protein
VVAASGRPQRHRAAISSQQASPSGEKKATGAVRSAISTGTHRP